jgi:hypothetical protein
MATAQIRSDWYALGSVNTIVDPYQKNGTVKVGKYLRDAANLYVAECLVACDVSSIPSGSTVTSVTCSFNLASTNLSGAPSQTILLKKQDNGTWNDNGSTEPVYNAPNPPFDTSHAWPTALSSLSSISNGDSGIKTIPTSAGLVALVQEMVDGTFIAHNGIILAMTTSYYDWWININAITVDVVYTSTSSTQGLLMMF